MAYQALYRKYRSKTFDEIVGQTAVKTALQNQVKYNRIGHAYLFCGTRGTGKTSMAKVFARAVNCLHPIDGNPCNECELCKEAESGFNVIEIDAASNNSVDNIRDLREEVQYTPSKGRYKVYIIDEVHMLSTSAFNALLKTLEEPPEHVIFVLATTDPQKVLPTIISRCQRYDFKRIATADIQKHLSKVCREEGIQAEDSALHYIASLSDGAMRDALSILDQCHAYYMDETLTLEKVRETLGAVETEVFTGMTDALARKDTKELLAGVQKVFDDGRDAVQFVISWAGYLRNLLLLKVTGPSGAELLEIEEGEKARLEQQVRNVSAQELTYWIETLARLSGTLKTESQKRILLEVTLIRMTVETGEEGIPKRLEGGTTGSRNAGNTGNAASGNTGAHDTGGSRLERAMTQPSGTAPIGHVPSTPAANTSQAPKAASTQAPGPASALAGSVDNWWSRVKEYLAQQGANLPMLSHITPAEGPEEGTVLLTAPSAIYLRQLTMNDNARLRQIEEAIATVTGKRIRLILKEAAGTQQTIQDKINMEIQWR